MSTWNIDPAHSAAEFKIRHMMITNVKGRFTAIKDTLHLDDFDHTKSSVEATIAVESMAAGDPHRDVHLKSQDFFDVERHPSMSFRSTEIVKRSNGELTLAGDLTMHGVTQPVVFAVEGPTAPGKDPWGKSRVGISADTKINRKDFGLTWNAALESGGILVGEEVQITLDIQFIEA